MRVETKLIHAGEPRPRPERAVAMPIYQSSTFEYAGATDYHDIQYIRLNNTPNHAALHAKLAALEGTEAALVASSGMAAISSTLLPRLGITAAFVDASRPETWAAAVTPRTRVFYVETLTNPTIQLVALDEVARFA